MCLDEQLYRLGFKTTREFGHNEFSIFGKSRPDFAFCKKQQDILKVGILIQPPSELQEIKMYSGALEFKLDIRCEPKRIYPQAFADMVRVAHDILIDALKVGKVVDDVVVYALLVGYDKQDCIPLKYKASFHDNHYDISVGIKDAFDELFPKLTIIGLR